MTRLAPVPDAAPAARAAAPVPAPEIGLDALWRGKGTILLVTAAAVLLGALYAYRLATPVYRSHALIMLEPQERQVIDLGAVLPGLGRDEQVLNTQVEMLRSRALVGRLVDRLGLAADPEFNPALRAAPRIAPKRLVRDYLTARGLIDPRPAPPVTPRRQRDAVIGQVIRALEVSVPPDSLVLTLTAETGAAEKSARIVNALAGLYIEDQIAAKLAATGQATEWLTGRVVELKETLETSEARARAARAEYGRAGQAQLDELERRLAALRARLESPDTTGSVRARLVADEPALEAEIAAAAADLVALQQLEREVAANRLLYETFLGRLKETSIQDGAERADARVISEAVVPRYPSFPKPPLILAVAAILGAGLGALIVLMREQWQGSFRSADELARATALPVLAAIPQLRERRRDPLDYAMHRPNSFLAEAVRDLRTSIMLSDIDAPPQVIMVTSSVPHEGKTTHSLLLAQLLAGWGKSVLVIEADIRRNAFQGRLGTPARRGILSVLAGLCAPDEAILRPDGMSFDVLLGEASSANAADIFATSRFGRFIAEMRRRYDYIVIDTPPVLVAADARVIAPETDAIVYAVRWKKTNRGQVRRGLAMFQALGIAVTGTALTRVNPRRMRRYGQGGAYGDYASKARYYAD